MNRVSRIARFWILFALVTTSVALQAQSPCTWDQTQIGKITETCGSVGVGTTGPWGGLHLFGAGQTASNPTVTSTSQASNGASLFLQDSLNGVGNGGMVVFGSGNGFFAGLKGAANSTTGATGSLLFLTRGQDTDPTLTERMRILPSGNILIGPAWDENAKIHVVETGPRMWNFVTDNVRTINQSEAFYFTWNLASRSWHNVATGIAQGGVAGALYLEAYNTGSGSLTNAVGGSINVGAQYGTGTVGTATGLQVRMAGAVSTGYGINIDDLSAANAWGIYQAGTNDQNYFAGKITIGPTSASPTALLQVNGDANFTGTVTGGNIQARYQDLAEWVPARQDLPAGTVVVLDSSMANMVTASTKSYDTMVAGVVSAQPGIALGVPDSGKEQIATTGRVKVRVDATRAPIQIGDLLVTSDQPGMAMKSQAVSLDGIAMHRPGTIVGKALEPLASGEGEILVLLSLQ